MLASPEWAVAVTEAARCEDPGVDEAQVVLALKRLQGVWDQLFAAERNRLLHLLIERVQLKADGVDIVWRDGAFPELIGEFADRPLVREQREVVAA